MPNPNHPNDKGPNDPIDIFADQKPEQAQPGPQAAPPQTQAPKPEPTIQQTILTPKEQEELFKREKLSTLQKIILIVISILVIGALVGGGIWLYFALTSTDSTETNTNANTNTVNENTNAVTVNENENTNTNTNTDPNKDTDKDGLTDADEAKYGTDKNKKDTDGDGYNDGEEVEGGYNPLGEGNL
ncbi:MAG: hypothetical protein ABID45_01080 [Patescibacteria group bacterium]